MVFIELTTEKGSKFTVNMGRVESINIIDKKCFIKFAGDSDGVAIKESYEVVKSKLSTLPLLVVKD